MTNNFDHLLAIGMPGTSEMIILAAILLLFYGPKKLPELARAIGGAVTSFREGLAGTVEPPSPSPAAKAEKAGDSPRIAPPRAEAEAEADAKDAEKVEKA